MSLFRETLPDFYAEVSSSLSRNGLLDVAEILGELEISSRSSVDHRGRISLAPGVPIEDPDRASRSGDFRWLSVGVERGNVELRLDSAGRVRALEYFARGDVGEALDRAGIRTAYTAGI